MGELNHKAIAGKREARQQGKLPFLPDARDLVTIPTQLGKVGLGWMESSAQAGATIHPPAVRNADHLVLG